MQAAATATAEPRPSPKSVWLVLLGGALAWLVHLVGSYLIADFGCTGAIRHATFAGVSGVAWSIIVFSIVMTIVTAVPFVVSYRRWRRYEQEADEESPKARRPWLFTSWISFGMNATFLFAVIFETIPVLYYLPNC